MPGQISHAKDSPQPKKRTEEKPAESAAAAPAASDADSSAESSTQSGTAADADSDADSEADADADAEVPQGTTTEILRWVGDDKNRAQSALDAEQSHDRPRTGLVNELKKRLEE